METHDVVVVGAGLAGLTAAKALKAKGLSVLVVDKARGSGGRLSSKRLTIESGLGLTPAQEVSFDLGATGLIPESDMFRAFMQTQLGEGTAEAWYSDPSGRTVYVGVPRNSSLTRSLVRDLTVRFATRVTSAVKTPQGWQLMIDRNGLSESLVHANTLILATPPAQASAILPMGHTYRASLADRQMLPQWVVALILESDTGLRFNELSRPGRGIANISIESSKPGRPSTGLTTLQIQSTTQWAQAHLDDDFADVTEQLHSLAELAVGRKLLAKHRHVHRWLYARPIETSSPPVCLPVKEDIAVCGDYLAYDGRQSALEAAYLSGQAVAGHVLVHLGR